MGLLGPVTAMMMFCLPDGFVDVATIDGVQVEARYAGTENFLGRPVNGYEAPKAFISTEAAAALAKVQADLVKEGFALKVFDAYRPQRAVDHFMAWIADTEDTARKATYYPDVQKSSLVPDGYIAEKSGHSRGSTVDLTIVRLSDGAELDMGSPWDFFGPISHALTNKVSASAQANRMKLRSHMIKHGFKPYEAEWWHFTLEGEPYPNTYFDFEIK